MRRLTERDCTRVVRPWGITVEPDAEGLMVIARAIFAVVGAVVITGCPVSREEFARIADDARACDEGDTCVVAGGSECTCWGAVNEDRADEVQAAADSIVCCTPFDCLEPLCRIMSNPRCENGECIADPR